MDLATWALFGLVAVMGVNQLVSRTPAMLNQKSVVLFTVAVDVSLGLAVIILGLPGYETIPGVQWMVGMMLLFHGAQAVQARNSMVRKRVHDAEMKEQETLRQHLRDTRPEDEQ